MTSHPDDSPGFLLWQVTLRWQREITATLAPLDLTHVQFVLLANTWWLNGQDEEPNQLTLARRAATDIKMTSQVVRKLEEKGLLERRVDPADTRAKRLRVTERGAKVAREAIATVEAADAEFFRRAPDPAALLRILKPLAAPPDEANP
jgi:DNA-binding MarR family transcriptional regulator